MIGGESTFTVDKINLDDILESIHDGKIQLPDFQREWVWDDEHVRDLIESISLSYPIGTIMLLEVENNHATFQPRLIDGSPKQEVLPEYLILDGQQRLTSMYQSLLSKNIVKTRDPRKKPIEKWYYIDMRKAIYSNGDRAESIISLGKDKKVKNFRGEVLEDYSTLSSEYQACYFPFNLIFDCSEWRREFSAYWHHDASYVKLFDDFEKKVIENFKSYLVPIIFVKKETPKEAVCQVFEKVNTGGVSLTVFELLTATFAASNYRLRDDWKLREISFKEWKSISAVKNTDFLQAISLLVTYNNQLEAKKSGVPDNDLPGVSCKRKDILKLSVQDYKLWADRVERGFIQVAKFLYNQHIFSSSDLPYQTQIVPLASFYAWMNKDSYPDYVNNKLAQWYWCGVLGELYGSAVESRFARDLPELIDWISGKSRPKTIDDANFIPNRLLTLRSRLSAAYKGVHALIMRKGCLDWRTGSGIDSAVYFNDFIDIHHIFPYTWCVNHQIDPGKRDSIVNKTALSATTNRKIQGKAPSLYLVELKQQNEISKQRMENLLLSHAIAPANLYEDDFEGFFNDRFNQLINIIEEAMGKEILNQSNPDDEMSDDYEGLMANGN